MALRPMYSDGELAGIRSGKIPRPMRTQQKPLCFSSNRSTTESMIDSRKVHAWLDTANESQSRRATNNTISRFSPNRGVNYPFLPMAKKVPVIRNRRGIRCSTQHGPQESRLFGGNWIYAQILSHGS